MLRLPKSMAALLFASTMSTVSRSELVHAQPFGPPPPQNPGSATNGLATLHGDSAASDTTPLPGPGAGAVSAAYVPLLAACPSVVVASDGHPIALCTQIANQTPILHLLDPNTGLSLASRELVKGGSLFGGVYSYLDHQDRVVAVDGAHTLLWIGHRQGLLGLWELTLERSVSLATAVAGPCGSASCDGVVGLAPGYDGRIWFATGAGTIGVVDGTTSAVQTLALPTGETIDNGIASAPEGTAVVTSHALYLLNVDAGGAPKIVWRAPYDRGPARKPGQLSHGSGTTPTFFGPATGTEYLAILDNASPLAHLLVFLSAGPASPVCAIELPTPTGLGTENSPIGSGRSVIVASSYGYPYPAYPPHAGTSVPASAPISGGMARIDLATNGSGCSLIWTNPVHSAAVPKLSLADGLVYTIERQMVLASGMPSALDAYSYTTIAATTGQVTAQQTIAVSTLQDTLQFAGTIAPGGVLYQGTITGMLRIAP